MTLIKSVLLGSAAGIVAVASAQAADLPTHKAAPVAQYVKICDVGGITGWTLPGSDTCVKLSGYITAQFTGGNLSTQRNPAFSRGVAYLNAFTDTWARNLTGWTTRANFGLDIASNTAYGPLIGHFDINGEMGSGFDNTGTDTYVNTAYLTWAGITAGKAASFFSFVGGGDNWANFFSPDRKGFNQPNLLAYTASFGGGFSATLSFENPQAIGSSGGGTRMVQQETFYGGVRWPDIVGALHVKQGWGEAQLSGVLHNVNVRDLTYFNSGSFCGYSGFAFCNGEENKVGWAIDAGVKFNLPWWPGDTFLLTGAYSQNAVWYSGLPDGMWGENGQTNGNGQAMYMSDAFFNPLTNSWASPKAWSVSALLEHHWTPTFYTNLEGSIGGISWSNQDGYNCFYGPGTCFGTGLLSPKAISWIAGVDFGWNPVTNLNFDFELMYQGTHQDTPNTSVGTTYFSKAYPGGIFVPGDWNGSSSGFAGRLRITRYF